MSDLEACPACNVLPERCSFCTDPARYFLEADILACAGGLEVARQHATVYFCDRHADSLLSDEARGGEGDIEVGLYTPNSACAECDSWA